MQIGKRSQVIHISLFMRLLHHMHCHTRRAVIRESAQLNGYGQFDHFCISTARLRPLYFDSVLRHFVKSGFIIAREALVEVKFGQKSRDQDNWSPTFFLNIGIQCAAPWGVNVSELATQSGWVKIKNCFKFLIFFFEKGPRICSLSHILMEISAIYKHYL